MLPFGLFGAPATFQHLMDRILRPHTAYAAAYLDDIIIYSNNWQRHMEHLLAVQRALRGADWLLTWRSVRLGMWRSGIWASTWDTGRCVPKLIRPQLLRPAQDLGTNSPPFWWVSSWGWWDIIEGLYLIIRTSPARWLTSLKRKRQIQSSGRSCVSRLSLR